MVDDEQLLLTMAETILGDCGYKVLTADNGEKALALLSRDDTEVDLVVTDLVMPGMSGRELMERIRQLLPGMKLLCMSGYVMPADKQTGHDLSAKAVHQRRIAGQGEAGRRPAHVQLKN